MADYYPLIARAIAGLGTCTSEARRAVYDSARVAQQRQLRKLDPPITDADIGREREALETAIRSTEAVASATEHVVSDAKIISDFALFCEQTKTIPDCFYDVSVLPHPKEVIVAAIERQIILEPLDARVDWLRTGPLFLWNFLEGVGSTPLPMIDLDLKQLPRDASPEILIQVANQISANYERAEPFRAIAERDSRHIESRIDAAISLRNEQLARLESKSKSSPAETTTRGYLAQTKKIAGSILAAVVGVGILVNWIMGALGYGPERHIYPYEHLVDAAATQEIWCYRYQDWVITTVTGPCKGFNPPKTIAKGQSFHVNGTSYVINVVIATRVDRDNVELGVRKGDWFCEAAEQLADLDAEGKGWRRTWLVSPKCSPL